MEGTIGTVGCVGFVAIAESSQDFDVWKAELSVEICGKREWVEDEAREELPLGLAISENALRVKWP